MAAAWSSLRASDRDRERVAERLKTAATAGRILAEELEERLARALRARTYGDLDAVVADLPGADAERYAQTPRRRGPARRLAHENPAVTVLALVALTLAVFVIAAVVLAGVFAFSGMWVLVGFLVFARGRPAGRAHHARARGRRRYRQTYR